MWQIWNGSHLTRVSVWNERRECGRFHDKRKAISSLRGSWKGGKQKTMIDSFILIPKEVLFRHDQSTVDRYDQGNFVDGWRLIRPKLSFLLAWSARERRYVETELVTFPCSAGRVRCGVCFDLITISALPGMKLWYLKIKFCSNLCKRATVEVSTVIISRFLRRSYFAFRRQIL